MPVVVEFDPDFSPAFSQTENGVVLREFHGRFAAGRNSDPVSCQGRAEFGVGFSNNGGDAGVRKASHGDDPRGDRRDGAVAAPGGIPVRDRLGERRGGRFPRRRVGERPGHGFLVAVVVVVVAVRNDHHGGGQRGDALGERRQHVVPLVSSIVGDGGGGVGRIAAQFVVLSPPQELVGQLHSGGGGVAVVRFELVQKIPDGDRFVDFCVGSLSISVSAAAADDVDRVPVIGLVVDHDPLRSTLRHLVHGDARESCGGIPGNRFRGDSQGPAGDDVGDGSGLGVDLPAFHLVEDDSGVPKEEFSQQGSAGQHVHVVLVLVDSLQGRHGILEGDAVAVVFALHGIEKGNVFPLQHLLEPLHSVGKAGRRRRRRRILDPNQQHCRSVFASCCCCCCCCC
mmetsp:Transcript_11789/g.23982  ORF Transcript_11789/g.23982 Transcript_11789/m.23982 type:complete len:396 (+) Transcript_11789:172-1359(+)